MKSFKIINKLIKASLNHLWPPLSKLKSFIKTKMDK